MPSRALMERLCALVPPPRKHLVTYHGVLAPASGLRPKVVPRQMAVGEEEAAGAAAGCRHGAGGGGVSQVAGEDNAATPATSAAAAVYRQQAELRARARLRVPHRGRRRRSRRQRLPRADLLRRAFGIDVLVCPKCAGPRRVLAAIHDPAAIARVLGALGLTRRQGPIRRGAGHRRLRQETLPTRATLRSGGLGRSRGRWPVAAREQCARAAGTRRNGA